MNIKNQTYGFTVTEVTITVIILGVLAAIALPQLTGTIERTRAAEGAQILNDYLKAQNIYKAQNGTYLTHFSAHTQFDIQTSQSAYFDPVTIAMDNAYPTPIVYIRRTNAYFLGINERGEISCLEITDPQGVPIGPLDFTCAQAGY